MIATALFVAFLVSAAVALVPLWRSDFARARSGRWERLALGAPLAVHAAAVIAALHLVSVRHPLRPGNLVLLVVAAIPAAMCAGLWAVLRSRPRPGRPADEEAGSAA